MTLLTDIQWVMNIVMLLLLVISAIAAVSIRNLLVSTVILSLFSVLMATQYLLLGAVDVAITEAAVGAGVSTLLFLMALRLVGQDEKKTKGNHLLPALVSAAIAVLLIYVALHMPAFGDPNAVVQNYLAPLYITDSAEKIGIPNVVTSVLASYRGYDTFGETVVVFTASVAVLMLIGGLSKPSRKEGESHE